MPTIVNPASNIMTDSSGFQDCDGQNNSTLEYLDPSELNRCDEINVVEIEKIEIKEHTLSNITDLDTYDHSRLLKIGVLPTIPEERASYPCGFVILVMCSVGMLIFLFLVLITCFIKVLIG